MIENWKEVTIQDFVDSGEAELRTGPFGTQLHASDYVEFGTPVINVRNIWYGNIRPEKIDYIDDATVQRLSGHLLEPYDIVFGRKGAVDRHVLIRQEQKNWFQGSDCLRLRIKSSLVDPVFVSYFFLTEEHKQWMINQGSHGATMGSLNQGIIKRIKLILPPLPTQRKIAAILSAYDDLIENNNRRIQILEEMAQSIYREWFVHFRFPGHESVRMVDSGMELREIPEGWEVRKISEVIEVLGGGTPSTKVPEYWENGDINWFAPRDLTSAGTMFIDVSPRKITQVGLQKSSAKMFPPNSVMMTSRATLGVTAINTQPACTNQGFITCIPNENLPALQIY